MNPTLEVHFPVHRRQHIDELPKALTVEHDDLSPVGQRAPGQSGVLSSGTTADIQRRRGSVNLIAPAAHDASLETAHRKGGTRVRFPARRNIIVTDYIQQPVLFN
jgi:hypothetical protein